MDRLLLGIPDFRDYVRRAWRIIEPATPFVPGWHIDAICEHLEAVTCGDIRRLIINVPPRHMKSLLVSVFWPTWMWIQQPAKRFLSASYAQPLATRDAVKSRRLIQSSWYQKNWGNVFRLTSDQNEKTRYENDQMGYRIATSTGGVATGEGGDVLILDDPHKADEAQSDTVRESDLEWLQETWSTRINDPKTSVEVIIMQRLHERDATGFLLEEVGGYEHLMLPAEFEPERKCVTAIGWEDPRKIEGELLWGDRFDQGAIADLKKRLGSYGAAGQLQQRPSPAEGGIFQREWFKGYRALPHLQAIIQSWDTAFKKGDENAYTVGQTWGVTPFGYFLMDLVRARMEYPELKRTLKAVAAQYQPDVILVEDKASGQSLVQDLRVESTLPLVAITPTQGDKIVRARLVSPMVEAGNVSLSEGASWVADFLEEIVNFPNSRFADQVDAMTQFLDYAKTWDVSTDSSLADNAEDQHTTFGGLREQAL